MLATKINDFVNPGACAQRDPTFPDAPDGWTTADAEAIAGQAGLSLTDEHWEIIRVLQGSYRDEAAPRIRTLCSALKARFKNKGGIEYVYELLPAGPLALGCKLAGLAPPSGVFEGAEGSAQ